ncbi:MAG: flippase, partial [Candidatus Nanohaloarchaea archaeon]
IAKFASIIFISTVFSKAIMYLYRILIAREIGPSAYGTLSLGLAMFWVFVSLGNLSIPNGIQRFISTQIGEGRDDKVKGTFITALHFVVPASLAASAALFLAARFLAARFSEDPNMVLYLRLMAAVIPVQILYQVVTNFVRAHNRFDYTALVDNIYKSLAVLLVTAALLFLGYGLFGAFIAQIIGKVTAAVFIVIITWKKVFPFFSTSSAGFRNHRDLFLYSYPLVISGIIGLITGWTDTLMLGWFDTDAQVGIYNAALPTAQILGVVGSSLGGVLFPTVATMYGRGDKQESIRVTAAAVKWMFAIAFPFTAVMILFSEPILSVLFGEAYGAGAVALSVLAVAYFTNTITHYGGTYIKAENRTKLSLINSSVTASLNFGLNLYLIPLYSTTGAGIATATSIPPDPIASSPNPHPPTAPGCRDQRDRRVRGREGAVRSDPGMGARPGVRGVRDPVRRPVPPVRRGPRGGPRGPPDHRRADRHRPVPAQEAVPRPARLVRRTRDPPAYPSRHPRPRQPAPRNLHVPHCDAPPSRGRAMAP